jgi:hypothetical protein
VESIRVGKEGHKERRCVYRIVVDLELIYFCINRLFEFCFFVYLFVCFVFVSILGGRVCSFSPCIEQVQKTSQEMTQLGFTNIYTIELLRRILSVKKFAMANFDFNMDMMREKRPPSTSKSFKEDELSSPVLNKNETTEKNKIVDDAGNNNQISMPSKEELAQEQPTKKKALETNRKRTIDNEVNMKDQDNSDKEDSGDDDDDDDDDLNKNGYIVSRYAAKAINQQPGHTGFLTFATLLHKDYLKTS